MAVHLSINVDFLGVSIGVSGVEARGRALGHFTIGNFSQVALKHFKRNHAVFYVGKSENKLEKDSL